MLGIIGGTGLYAIEGFEASENRPVETPYGATSAPLAIGRLAGREVAFLPRHGGQHGLLPHEINYRANVWALKAAGVRRVLSVSATGSLAAELAPGSLAVPGQYLDLTKGKRAHTFFGEGLVAHVSTAEPTCPALTASIVAAGEALGTPVATGKTYACVEGPRLGTRAESHFMRLAGCHLVGMTNVPEVFLAAEAQLCYATVAIVTDYDCWMEDPSQHATVDLVMARYKQSVGEVQAMIAAIAASEHPVDCACRKRLEGAVVTPESALGERQRALLDVLRA